MRSVRPLRPRNNSENPKFCIRCHVSLSLSLATPCYIAIYYYVYNYSSWLKLVQESCGTWAFGEISPNIGSGAARGAWALGEVKHALREGRLCYTGRSGARKDLVGDFRMRSYTKMGVSITFERQPRINGARIAAHATSPDSNGFIVFLLFLFLSLPFHPIRMDSLFSFSFYF
jgi:hypothetical protein